MSDGKQTLRSPRATSRKSSTPGADFGATAVGKRQRAADRYRRPLTWGTAEYMDAMCGGHCITDDEIYGEIDAIVGREKGTEAIFEQPLSPAKDREDWKELVGILQKDVEKAKIEKRPEPLFEDLEANIRYLRYRLRSGKLEPDKALYEAAQLDASRLLEMDVKPYWVQALIAARLTVLVDRFDPVTPKGVRLKEEVTRFIDVHAKALIDAFAEQTAGAIFTALSVMTSPAATVNGQSISKGELMLAAEKHEERELFNIALTMAMPVLMVSAAAKHTPILGTILDFMMDPGGTLEGAWDTITHPRRTWRGIKAAKEEHGWNAFNPAYWVMVHWYEAGQAFERWGKTKDPKHAFEGIDRFGQSVGSGIDTVGAATGITALRPGRFIRDVKDRVGRARKAIDRVTTRRRRPKGGAGGAPVPQRKWPPEPPEGTKPPRGAKGADEWRYQRYRYQRYKEGRSQDQILGYDEWFKRSRGGRGGGAGHAAIQKKLVDRGYDKEVRFGNRWADAANDKEVVQIGGVNPKRGDPIKREREAVADIIKDPSFNDREVIFWDKSKPNAPPPQPLRLKRGDDGRHLDPQDWRSWERRPTPGKTTKPDAPVRGRFFGKKVGQGDPTLRPGEGETDKFGNYKYSTKGTKQQQSLAKYHEQVHSALSPKLDALRKWRADLAMAGYRHSHLLRYVEEALAEAYAQLRVHGIRGLPSAIRFPVSNGYVTVSRVLTEAAIGTIVIGGVSYGVYIVVTE